VCLLPTGVPLCAVQAPSRLPATSKQREEDTRERLTVHVTTWLLRPCIDDAHIEQLLQLLTDDMAGF
jgi:hypothetical protein